MLFFPLAALAAPDPALVALVAPLGVDRLDSIERLSFTFVVERDGAAKASRAWTWSPSTREVTRRVGEESLTFVAGSPKSEEERKADAQFVNDSFWLLPHLHLRWAGDDLVVEDAGTAPLPVGAGEGHKLVLRYRAEGGGGYTPGDVYDLYLDAEGKIAAWAYHPGGAPEPSLSTSFADWVTVGPLTIASDHASADGAFHIRFTDLSVTQRSSDGR